MLHDAVTFWGLLFTGFGVASVPCGPGRVQSGVVGDGGGGRGQRDLLYSQSGFRGAALVQRSTALSFVGPAVCCSRSFVSVGGGGGRGQRRRSCRAAQDVLLLKPAASWAVPAPIASAVLPVPAGPHADGKGKGGG